MRYIRTYENRYETMWDDSKEYTTKLIDTIQKIITTLYPEVEISILEKEWANSEEFIIELKNIENLNIERLISRYITNLQFMSIETHLFNITIKFKGLLDNEVDEVTIAAFFKSIFKNYQTNSHNYIFSIDNKNIEKVIDEITLENYELFSDVEKYNL